MPKMDIALERQFLLLAAQNVCVCVCVHSVNRVFFRISNPIMNPNSSYIWFSGLFNHLFVNSLLHKTEFSPQTRKSCLGTNEMYKRKFVAYGTCVCGLWWVRCSWAWLQLQEGGWCMYGLAGSLWCKQNKKLTKQYLTPQCFSSLPTSPPRQPLCRLVHSLSCLLASTQKVQW